MPQVQDNFRVLLVIILLIWLLSSPDDSTNVMSTPSLRLARLARQQRALDVLNSTRWGDFAPEKGNASVGDEGDQGDQKRDKDEKDKENKKNGAEKKETRFLDLPGFRSTDGLAWEDLRRFRKRCREWSRHANPWLGDDVRYDDDAGWSAESMALPTWQNVTGVVGGRWTRRGGSVLKPAASYNLSETAPGPGWSASLSDWDRNVTGQYGKMFLRIEGKPEAVERDGAREVSSVVTLQDDDTGGSSWAMKLHGVHWPRQGVLLLTTTSEKFAGIFGLPHLAPGRDFFESGRKLLNETVEKALWSSDKAKRLTEGRSPWTSELEGSGDGWSASPHCEYVMYAQVHPLDAEELGGTTRGDGGDARRSIAALVQEVENELRNPTGALVECVPALKISVVAWSPDCAFFLESKGPPLVSDVEGRHLNGIKDEVLVHRAKNWLLSFAAVVSAQMHLLKGHMKEYSTPSELGRVSLHTASIMLLADGMTFAGAATWSLSRTDTYLASLVVTAAALVSMLVGCIFLSDVYRAQEPERRSRQRARTRVSGRGADRAAAAIAQASPPASSAHVPDDGRRLLPQPATSGPPRLSAASPVLVIPSDQDMDADITDLGSPTVALVPPAPPAPPHTVTPFSSVTGRLLLLGTCLLFVSLAATSWPSVIRSLYVNTLAAAYLSLWLPQILRNASRHSCCAFSWRFVAGQSVLRLLPLAYFYLREDNLLFAQPDPRMFCLLAAWVWIQVWFLAVQDVLGPRFAVPRSWVREAWNYHPVLKEEHVEAGGLPIGLVSPGERRKSEGPVEMRAIDCAICRDLLEVPVVRRGKGAVVGLLQRRVYMVTPCRHLFHAACLEGWLRYRLQCPICREELPPL